jgi:G3E family GTPase
MRQVTILSGFLGSGKTTLLRSYLARQEANHAAAIINEYGAIGIDHHLVRLVEERTILVGGGCVCCNRREDLASTLRELLDLDQQRRTPKLDQVLIETSGLADPAPILFTLTTDPVLRHHFTVGTVVVTLDAINGDTHLVHHPEVVKQVVAADQIIITKADLRSKAEVQELGNRVGTLNPSATITTSALGSAAEVLRPSGVGRAQKAGSASQPPSNEGAHPSITSTTLDFNQPLDWTAFSLWLSLLLHAWGGNLLRIKGLLDVGRAGPVILNSVQHVIHPPEHLAIWPTEAQSSHLVFITNELPANRIGRSLEAFQKTADMVVSEGSGGAKIPPPSATRDASQVGSAPSCPRLCQKAQPSPPPSAGEVAQAAGGVARNYDKPFKERYPIALFSGSGFSGELRREAERTGVHLIELERLLANLPPSL